MNPIQVTLSVADDQVVHSQINCNGADFDTTLKALKLFINELQEQVKNRSKCPFSPKEKQ
jgi:hypothetical protein